MLGCLFLLTFLDPPAPPTVTIPATLSGAPGSLIAVKAETTSKIISWSGSPGITFVQPYPADPACKVMLVHAQNGGTYTIFAAVPNGDAVVSAVSVVTIGPAPPPPPPPAPTFQDAVNSAVKADGVTKDQVARYAALYRAASTVTVNDAGITTVGALMKEMQAAVKALGLPPGSFAATSKLIATELASQFKTTDALDATTRARVSSEFVKIASALEGAN